MFASALKKHLRNVENGQETVFHAYGPTGPEEFFAVAVEAFFEKPAGLKDEDPAVFQQSAGLFLLDPATWA